MTERLLYKDGNGDNTVLAVLDGDVPSGAYKLRRARAVFRNRAIDKVEVIGGSDLFKNVPYEDNDFTTSDPAIFFQTRKFQTGIVGVDTNNDQFTVSGNRTEDFTEGGAVQVKNSNRSDNTTIYKVASQSDVSYDSNADETTITVVETVSDGTVDGDLEGFENVFRGYSENEGKITQQGVCKVNLYSFKRFTGFEDTTVSSSNTVKDVASKLTPSGYTLDAPSSFNVNYVDSTGTQQTGFAPVDNFEFGSQRRRAWRDLERKYGYSVTFKADKTVRFEPIGYAGSVDTIDSPVEGQTNNTRGNWLEWQSGEKKNVVNTVQVINEKDGNEYDSGVITDSNSVNRIGKRTPESGLEKHAPWVDSDQEAKRVAYNIISKDGQNPEEGGRVVVSPNYVTNVSNSTFTLNDSTRDLDGDTFVCWEHVNFYPEGKSELRFQFEAQDEHEAGIEDDVSTERAQLIGSKAEDVGQQNFNGDTGSAPSDTGKKGGVDDGNSDTTTSGGVDNGGPSTTVADADTTATTSANDVGFTTFVEFSPGATDTQGGRVHILFRNSDSSADAINIRVKNKSTGNTWPLSGGAFSELYTAGNAVAGQRTVRIPENTSGQTYQVQLELINNNQSETGWFCSVQWVTYDQHDHPDNIVTVDNLHSHPDDIDTEDFDHGGTGDATGQHGTSGTTDSKNVDVGSGTKKDYS